MPEFEQVAVVGSGLMGRSIAILLAENGREVVLAARGEASLKRAREEIKADLKRPLPGRKPRPPEEVMGAIRGATRLEEIQGAGLVIEAIVEELGAKRELFRDSRLSLPLFPEPIRHSVVQETQAGLFSYPHRL